MANHTDPTRQTPGLDDWLAAELQVVKASTASPQPLPAGAWVYPDAEGEPLMATTRQELPDGRKSFWQWTPIAGGWISEGLAGPKPLYRLDVIANSGGSVAIVEGEKCADAVLAAWPDRQSVTTWPGGCRNWENVDSRPPGTGAHASRLLKRGIVRETLKKAQKERADRLDIHGRAHTEVQRRFGG